MAWPRQVSGTWQRFWDSVWNACRLKVACGRSHQSAFGRCGMLDLVDSLTVCNSLALHTFVSVTKALLRSIISVCVKWLFLRGLCDEKLFHVGIVVTVDGSVLFSFLWK